MKKNKTIAFAMAACLLVGGTFMGTKALFTDETTATNDLVITMGNLDIEVVEEDGWKVKKFNHTESEKVDDNSFKTVKPGDKFYKKVMIKNTGDLNQEITVDTTALQVEDMNIKENIKSRFDKKVLEAGKSASGYIYVEVNEEMAGLRNAEGSYNKDGEIKIDFNKLGSVIKLDAKQTDRGPSIILPIEEEAEIQE